MIEERRGSLGGARAETAEAAQRRQWFWDSSALPPEARAAVEREAVEAIARLVAEAAVRRFQAAEGGRAEPVTGRELE